MALTIVATAKSSTANSYVTLAEAEAYMVGRLAVTNWDAATDDEKNRSLKMATDELEKYEYKGIRTTQAQRLQWPRYDVLDRDGWAYDQDTVPRPIKEATYELALALTDGTYEIVPNQLAQFERVRVGSLDISPRDSYQAAPLPDPIRRLIAPLLLSGGGGLQTSTERG